MTLLNIRAFEDGCEVVVREPPTLEAARHWLMQEAVRRDAPPETLACIETLNEGVIVDIGGTRYWLERF